MLEKKLVIADGHHRYETALNYRNECRARAGKSDPMAASEFAMATFINTHSRGLTILPTHRLVSRLANLDFERFRKNLAPHFDWYSYPFAECGRARLGLHRVPQGSRAPESRPPGDRRVSRRDSFRQRRVLLVRAAP